MSTSSLICSAMDNRLIDRLDNNDLLDQFALAVEEGEHGSVFADRVQARKDAAEYRAEILTRMGC